MQAFVVGCCVMSLGVVLSSADALLAAENADDSHTRARDGVFNIRDYGAKGDGVTLNTVAINRALDACASTGGGQVLIPSGRYLSGTLHLRSHITLFLAPG